MSLPPPLPAENPYAAPTAVVDDPATGELIPADRSARLAAAIVDGLLLFGPLMLLAVMGTPLGPGNDNELAIGLLALFGVGGLLAVLIINAVMLHKTGQTIGKRMLSIRIVLADGSPCSLLRVIFARWLPVTLMGLVPVVGYVIGFVDALLIFRDDRRCLHDQIAGTIVVRA